tara:strand:- start:525 stop:806 length:282 start_codon:yes stop_codon:yes gene_type:complete
MDTPYTPKEYILNVLNQCLVSLQEADDFEIMKPEIIKAARLVQNIAEKPSQKTDTTPHVETDEEYAKRVAAIDRPDTPDIDSIAEINYENRRT